MAAQVVVTCFQDDEFAPLRVLCLPHAGGNTKALGLALAKRFHDAKVGVEVWGVDWSWNDDNAQADVSLRQWLDAVRSQLSSRFFDKPYVVLGHSLGALAAFALVEYLQTHKFALPKHVFLSGATGPSDWTLFDNAAVLQRDEALLSLLKQWGGTDAEFLEIPDQRAALLKRLRADLKLHNVIVEWYQQATKEAPSPLLHASVSVLGGDNDSSVPAVTLDGWKAVVDVNSEAHSFEVQMFAGDHFFLSSAGSQDAFTAALIVKLQAVSTRNALESHALIQKWNSKKAPYPSDKCLHDLFADAVKRSPDDIAVYYEGKTLTFKEVDEQSERLADYLFQVGVRPNRISGIFMEHCIEFVIAYIAALKAGGAYMPLEIVYPPDLLARVLEESKPTIILTKKTFRNRLPEWQETLNLDSDWLDALRARNVPPMPVDRVRTQPDDLAYVVMSSGTTGVPKGICCPHRGAVHSYDWRLVNCPFIAHDRVASHVFFVWELLRPMLGNKPLYIIPDDTIYDPVRLVEYISQHAITRILFTPSLLQLILDTCAADVLLRSLQTLRLVWLCGEVVTIELRDRFVRLFPDCELQNLYSVSECHDASAVDLAHMSAFDNALSAKYASCGEVMPNVSAYVLDDNYKPVSIGVPGELYIGGPCLAIGYLNRPEQTAQRFLEDVVPGERVYKTGDRARFLPNGHLELIGRCDFMVKIRGYSVVLGAVESALAQHPLVSTAVVLTEGDEGQDKRLVAYIVPDNWEKVPSVASLREFLKERLPHYAIPSIFVQLDALPINSASGKLDRKKMPSADQAKKLRSESIDLTVDVHNRPQTETEVKLAAIWVELLRLENDKMLNRNVSFFDVGGHSLLATRLVSSIRDAFDVQVTLADILAAPELVAIATRIDAVRRHVVIDEPEPKQVVLPLEALLDASIYPAATRKAGYSRYRVEMVGRPPRSVLLTGATGFLGAHLLHALIKDTETTVYCLVRAVDEEQAHERIQRTLKAFGLLEALEPFHVDERVVAIPGDLSKPLLGLEQDTFKMLATEVDAIIHNGAEVNLVKPYSSLKSANVLGTQEVLRLAVTNGLAKTRVKPVHYISTNGVFPSSFAAPTFLETANLKEISEHLENGYAQSKWVAEQMCDEAAQRGLPVSILRPGNMAPSSTSGEWNTSDFIYLLLKGCWEIGAVPSRPDWRFDMTPVDFAARAIVHFAALHPVTSLGQTLHIQNAAPPVAGDVFFQLLTRAASAKGKSIEVVADYVAWKQRLEAYQSASRDVEKLVAGLAAFESYFASDKVFDSARATELLSAADIACPAISAELLATYVTKW
uniref:Carrier domain-containing protein n=1 Tax=Globisporangium ultimum (strain ATCC 200006 / CBS 805.95 / DAOM BR144) TaxID=431595 RepID=K3WR86_GLOUD